MILFNATMKGLFGKLRGLLAKHAKGLDALLKKGRALNRRFGWP